ncbi:LPXTG cell wall anchor domain-containing protein [Aeromicrobium sp. REDSEA-S38_B2]|uniref:LPXTG cell wall anchor domain-containing protein n=1 Tax=Aeromicrobium sp. REDSEA-S38_B2 TaxID=1811528 RepID=UPI000A8F0807|nr:LPXTG cell wall anchor domain-containing protein [Aeromicrobium sp. REDSEA-S38_B2]
MRLGSRRTTAAVAAGVVAVAGLVVVAAPSQAALPTSGDRIAHWSAVADSEGGSSVVQRADIPAPSGQRFTEVLPVTNVDNVVALTDRQEVHFYGSSNLQVPAGLDGSTVRDVDVSGPVLGVVTASGDVTTWNRFGGDQPAPQPPADLCPATQLSVGGTVDFAVVRCEDGSVEAFGRSGVRWSVPADLPEVTEVRGGFLSGAAGPIVRVLTKDQKVLQWAPSSSTAPVTASENPVTQGKQVASLTTATALTTSGAFLDLGINDQLAPTRPVRRGGATPALLAKPLAHVAVADTGAGQYLTRDGEFDGWSPDTGVMIELRKLPTRLSGASLVSVGTASGHSAVIVADTAAPEGPKVTAPSQVSGATNGAARPGDTLTGKAATFDPASDDVTTQWLVDGKPVAGTQDQPTFAVTSAQVGSTIAFRTSAAFPDAGDPLVSDSSTISVVKAEGPSVVRGSAIEGFGAPDVSVKGTFASFSEEPEDREAYWLVDEEKVAGQGTPDAKELLLTEDMVGKKVRFVTVGYFADDVEVESVSDPLTVRVKLAEVSPPTVEGTPEVGATLKVAKPAVFNDDSPDVTVSHKWYRDFVTVVGEGDTYTLTKDDVGSTIYYSAEAIRPGEAFPAYSFDFTGIGPVTKAALTITGLPVIEGDAVVGKTLTASPAPSSDDDAMVAFQWFADGQPIDGATEKTLVLTDALVGKPVTVRQTVSRDGATEPGANLAQATSEPRTVRAKPVDLTVTKPATVEGKRIVGQTVTGSPATFSDPEAGVTSYWMVDGRRTAATGATLTLTSEHVGASIRYVSVAERAEDDATAESVSEGQVGPVLAQVAVKTATRLSGTAKVGKTLTATPATFTGGELTVDGSWWADGQKLDQGGLKLPLTAELEGAVITFRATASRSVDGIDEQKSSDASSRKVAAADSSTPPTTPPTTPPGGGTDPKPPAAGQPSTDIVKGSTTVERGDVLTLQLSPKRAGDKVVVMLFSTPTNLGTHTVAADGTVRVRIPQGVDLGRHRIAVYDAASGALLAWQAITVVDSAGGSGAGGVGAGGAASLPDTGTSVDAQLVGLGAALLLVGAGAIGYRSRRRPRHRVG